MTEHIQRDPLIDGLYWIGPSYWTVPSDPIREGTVKKGGQNPKPITPRPAPPRGQGTR